MKLKAIAVLAAVVGLIACVKPAQASVVSVSSSTVTTIVNGNSSRQNLVLYNSSAGLAYYSTATSSATVAAGMVLKSSETIQLDGFKGALYGLAPAGSANIEIRYHSTSR